MIRLALIAALLFGGIVNAQEPGRGYKPLTPERAKALYDHSNAKHEGRLAMLAKFQALPASFDCREKGWVIPVGDQGQCGSCYLYSTIYGTLTQAFVRAGYGKGDGSFVMAVQYGMDCHNFGGCDGGNGTEVIDWLMKNGGWPAEKWVDTAGAIHKDYPAYEARSRACRKVPGAKMWMPADWGFVSASANRPATTLEIKTALYNYGPLNVSLDAGGQFGNGTYTITALGKNIDHEIELVAYDDGKDGGAFLLKNQWTTDWGTAGYRWVTYKAAANLVDVFFISAGALPPVPPPTPPVPPDPTPGGPVVITLTADQVASVLKQAGTPDDVAALRAKLAEIQKILDSIQKKTEPQTPKMDAQPLPKGEPEKSSWLDRRHHEFAMCARWERSAKL